MLTAKEKVRQSLGHNITYQSKNGPELPWMPPTLPPRSLLHKSQALEASISVELESKSAAGTTTITGSSVSAQQMML